MSAGLRLPCSESKERFWQALIDGFDPQQTSIRQWCEQQGVSQASFYGWRRKLQRREHVSRTTGNDTRPQLLRRADLLKLSTS
jgi:hypothetical protein